MDVKSRRCAAEGCNKYPAFNIPGENTARYCGDHRQQGMIDVHNKRCNFEGCTKRPTFNYPGMRHTPHHHCPLIGSQTSCWLNFDVPHLHFVPSILDVLVTTS